MSHSTLYIVATPIGNLEDISLRALRILGEVDFILCEDTRVTKKLLAHFKINTPTISYHQHSNEKKLKEILEFLAEGKNLALVSDAGTPGISDPGGKLVAEVLKKFTVETQNLASQATQSKQNLASSITDRSVTVESIPGPSAVTASLAISGIPTDKFVFLGFPPNKKGRQKFISTIANYVYPVVIYESKHRIIKLLTELIELNKEIIKKNEQIDFYNKQVKHKERRAKQKPITSVVVCRELSKMHETVYRGDIAEIIKRIEKNKDEQKGEFVVVVGK